LSRGLRDRLSCERPASSVHFQCWFSGERDAMAGRTLSTAGEAGHPPSPERAAVAEQRMWSPAVPRLAPALDAEPLPTIGKDLTVLEIVRQWCARHADAAPACPFSWGSIPWHATRDGPMIGPAACSAKMVTRHAVPELRFAQPLAPRPLLRALRKLAFRFCLPAMRMVTWCGTQVLPRLRR